MFRSNEERRKGNKEASGEVAPHLRSPRSSLDTTAKEREAGCTGQQSGVLDFAEMAASDVVDEAADGDGLGNQGMGAKLLQLVADIFIDVLEVVEEGGSNSGGCGG